MPASSASAPMRSHRPGASRPSALGRARSSARCSRRLLAYLVGRPILRLQGPLPRHRDARASACSSRSCITNESRWTGGPDGMRVARLEPVRLAGQPGPRPGTGSRGGLLLMSAPGSRSISTTRRRGARLRALHDSEVAARVVGIDVARLQAAGLRRSPPSMPRSRARSSRFMNGFINPDQAGFLHSVELVTMVVLGGLGSRSLGASSARRCS